MVATYLKLFLKVINLFQSRRRVLDLRQLVLALQQKVGGQLSWPSDPVLFGQFLN